MTDRDLLRIMRWLAVLSDGEATSCLRDYRAGFEYCCEAVNNFGGSTALVQRAIDMAGRLDWLFQEG